MTTLVESSPSRPQSQDFPGGWGGRGPEGGPGGRTRRRHRLARSRWARVGLPTLAVLCAIIAAAALAFPYLSGLYTRHEQQVLAGQLDAPAVGGAPGSGAAIGRIVIPAIGLDMVVVQGTDAAALAKGPGHYPDTPMPCLAGDVAIAGHRTTFLHPFYDLNDVKPGDVIDLSSRTFSCAYAVSAPPFAVSPRDTAVVANTPGAFTLTLTTCNPIGSSAQRLVVKADLVQGSVRALSASSRH